MDGLHTSLDGVELRPEADTVSWSLTSSGKFLVKSIYAKLTEGPTLDIARGLWKASIPLKIKVFLWQLFYDRLPSSNNIAIRHGPSDGSCALCGAHEDANHIFFNCHLAVLLGVPSMRRLRRTRIPIRLRTYVGSFSLKGVASGACSGDA